MLVCSGLGAAFGISQSHLFVLPIISLLQKYNYRELDVVFRLSITFSITGNVFLGGGTGHTSIIISFVLSELLLMHT